MSDARILDRGYRPYDGPRLGVAGAQRSLVRHTVQRVLGLRRPARAKVLPVMSALIAYLPAVVFVGVAALAPRDELRDFLLPTYAEYYGFIVSAIVVFVALVAPEAMCPDRRSGLLGLYLAAPLTRTSYLAAKTIGIASLLALSTLGPPLLLLVANILQGIGPDGPGEVAVLAVRVVVAGVVLTVIYTSVSLAVSSLTDRRAFAAAGVILLVLLTGAVTGAIEGAGGPEWLIAFNLLAGPFELVYRIYGERGEFPGVGTGLLVAVQVGWVVLGAAVCWTRYQRLVVTK